MTLLSNARTSTSNSIDTCTEPFTATVTSSNSLSIRQSLSRAVTLPLMSCTAVRKASSESLICECTPSSCALDRHQIEGFFKGILAGFASRSAGDKLLGFFQSFPDVGQPLAGDIVRLQSHHDAANGRCYRFACARQFDIALAISLQFPLQVPKRGCDLR